MGQAGRRAIDEVRPAQGSGPKGCWQEAVIIIRDSQGPSGLGWGVGRGSWGTLSPRSMWGLGSQGDTEGL